MIRTILIDDEKNAIEVLSFQLKNYCPDIEVIASCTGGEEAIDKISSLKPDLIFLDIEMPKVNGFDVLISTKGLGYKVIFTTAYNQYALKAFKFSAIDYLLKPIDIEELKRAVAQVIINDFDLQSKKINKLFEKFVSKSKSRLLLPLHDGYEVVKYEDIIRCQSDGNYTTIYVSNGSKYVISKTLKEVAKSIDSDVFFRVHNSHFINTDFITKIFKSDGGYIVMSDGCTINISRSKKEDFLSFMS